MRSAKGFTFVELCLGMTISAMVAGAAAAFLLATAGAWKRADSAQEIVASRNQVNAQFKNVARGARMVGAVTNADESSNADGQSAALIWRFDPNEDERIQQNELGLIIHDPSAQELRLITFENIPYAPEWTRAAFMDPASVVFWKDLPYETRVLARNVESANFAVKRPTTHTPRGILEYQLQVNRRGAREIVYGTAALRVSAKEPD